MVEPSDIEAVVFDVLGTMVDEPGGLRTAIGEVAPGFDDARVDDLLAVWQEHVENEQQRIENGDRAYAPSDTIDREAAQRVADRAGITDPVSVSRLATAGQRLEPWHDSVAALTRLARRLPVLALSNASRASLLRLNTYAGLRWHQSLSAEDARAYKPAPDVYRLAVDAAGCPPERVLMVAAHSWDLRGAQSCGMQTAYVERPVGDAPRSTDTFTWRSSSLDGLITTLTASPGSGGR